MLLHRMERGKALWDALSVCRLTCCSIVGGKKWGKQECSCWVRSKSWLLSSFLGAEAHPGSQCCSPGTSFRRVGWEGSSVVADDLYFSALHRATHCCSYGGLLPQWHWYCLGQVLCPTSPVWIAQTLRFLFVFRDLSAASSFATLQQQQKNTIKKNP